MVMLLTADHGNAETMIDEVTGKVQTAHTTNEVPFLVINGDKNIELKEDGALCDVLRPFCSCWISNSRRR